MKAPETVYVKSNSCALTACDFPCFKIHGFGADLLALVCGCN